MNVRNLLICVHDVTERHVARLREIHSLLDTHGIGHEYAMLVVPDFWCKWPLHRDSDFAGWLRERAHAGVEMIQHGYFHLEKRKKTDSHRQNAT